MFALTYVLSCICKNTECILMLNKRKGNSMVQYTTIQISPDELKEFIKESLKEIQAVPSEEKQTNELLTVKELAKLLKKTTKTVYLWCSTNKIPYLKTDKAILFDRDEVLKTLKNWHVVNAKGGSL